jgi:hypothetical protein
MALLNPPDALPEAMRFLLRVVVAHPHNECTRDKLISLVAPEGLSESMASIDAGIDTTQAAEGDDVRTGGRTIAERSLDALNRLGLVQIEKQTVIATSVVTSRWHHASEITAPSFAASMRNALFRVAEPTSDGVEEGVMDLVRGAALLVSAPDPLTYFDSFDSKQARRRFVEHQRSHYGTAPYAWPIGNRERWVPFRRFVVYLGLARPIGSAGLVADASQALREELADLPPGRIDIISFVQRCGVALPILDGGPMHLVDEGRDSAELSPGLSLSLKQLEADGLLRLERVGDAVSRVVALGTQASLRRSVSHVEWLAIGRAT